MIKIHNLTYITILISFLAGYFEFTYLFLLSIIIHEFGHYIFGKIMNFKFKQIIIYPYGGITIFDEDLNINSTKELFILLGGIIFECLFLLMVYFMYKNDLITFHVYNLINKINYLLISFNFMPIIPLDGGKLLNNLCDRILPYKQSNILMIAISLVFILIFLFAKISILRILLSIFMIKNIILEIQNIENKYSRFVLERYIKKYNFKKIKKVNSLNNLYRDKYHIINNKFESEYLSKLFDRIE